MIRIAVLGATGTIGREILTVLEERDFPANDVLAVATRQSIGKDVSFGDRNLKTRDADTVNWSEVDLCIVAAGSKAARQWAPRIAGTGCVVIDTSSAFRMESDIPLVVPEVNAAMLNGYGLRNIISSPGGATSQLVVALKPLNEAVGVKRAVVATYQSTSGAGREGMDELWTQTKGVYVNQGVEPRVFTKQIAFNVIPHVDEFMDDGSTREEWRLRVETQKILGSAVQVAATCVRVPVFVGHSEAVHLELGRPLSASDARALLREAPGVMVVDKREDEGYMTPVECVGEWAVYVSRIRNDPSVENGLSLWIVSDNLRKGAALNAVQIAEGLLNRGAFKGRRLK
ncbi:MAG: aspartate-semialdehyde dehydrogenase [Alphaproteobacteria bacterium]|nr:aspartate-semialdehyde dehydrogenase [Alphaproteobacteria bacterium]